jgi:hypothetical protein
MPLDIIMIPRVNGGALSVEERVEVSTGMRGSYPRRVPSR